MSSSNAGQCLELSVWNKHKALKISPETSDRKQDHRNKMLENKKLLKLLDDRLRILEEDDENLKGEFMSSMKERSDLISEVRECFQDILCSLWPRSQESGETHSRRFLAIEPLKIETTTGLLQVLCQESNPSLLTRGPTARAAVIHYHAWEEFSLVKHVM